MTPDLAFRSDLMHGAWLIARREIRDQFRDWRILTPIILLTLFFPILMNFTAQQAAGFVARYGAPIIGDRLFPFLLMVVGFFPISISLVIALESFAGERERQTLEPLLASPLSDGQLYIGKMMASLLLPLSAAYLGILVYLLGLKIRIGWSPPLGLMVQALLLTTAQAFVMVSGAVVLSSQATSVRSANLLASFIILPVSQLIIAESLIMFWGRYSILWLVVFALGMLGLLLGRIGLHIFHRETLLGREIDALNIRWAAAGFLQQFRSGAENFRDWHRGLLSETLPGMRVAILMTASLLSAGYAVGLHLATTFTLPSDLLNLEQLPETLTGEFGFIELMSLRGWTWIVGNNLRAILLASLLGVFSFGIVSELLLMAPIAIVGYIAGNLCGAGQDAVRILTGLVLPHAIFEVPAAILAGAAALRLGMVVISPGEGSTLGEAWIAALAEWARVMLGLVLPLLLLAALVEAFITPRVALALLNG